MLLWRSHIGDISFFIMQFSGYYKKIQKQQRWMITDLTNAAIDAHSNFLVAMGLFNYIEILGGYCLPNGTATDKFNFVFSDLLPQPIYSNIFNQINSITNVRDGRPYGILRCGMAHEYFIKTYKTTASTTVIRYTVMGVNNKEEFDQEVMTESCGIKLRKMATNKYHLIIYNARLIHDLNAAFNTFRKNIRRDTTYQSSFIQRAQEIHLEDFL